MKTTPLTPGFEALWYGNHPLRFALLPATFLYRLIAWIRREGYERGWLKAVEVAAPVIVVGTLQVASAIGTEATLSFLGIGLPITQPSLGLLIANGYQHLLTGQYWVSVFPGLLLLVLIFSINIAGDRLREVHRGRRGQGVPGRIGHGHSVSPLGRAASGLAGPGALTGGRADAGTDMNALLRVTLTTGTEYTPVRVGTPSGEGAT